MIVRDGQCYPIDFANATPDMAIISLHYYSWAVAALAKWSPPWSRAGRCRPHRDGPLVRRGRRPGPLLEEKLAAYRGLVDDYYERSSLLAPGDTTLLDADDWYGRLHALESLEFDAHLVATIQRAFPPHEHEQFVAAITGAAGRPGRRPAGGAAVGVARGAATVGHHLGGR